MPLLDLEEQVKFGLSHPPQVDVCPRHEVEEVLLVGEACDVLQTLLQRRPSLGEMHAVDVDDGEGKALPSPVVELHVGTVEVIVQHPFPMELDGIAGESLRQSAVERLRSLQAVAYGWVVIDSRHQIAIFQETVAPRLKIGDVDGCGDA